MTHYHIYARPLIIIRRCAHTSSYHHHFTRLHAQIDTTITPPTTFSVIDISALHIRTFKSSQSHRFSHIRHTHTHTQLVYATRIYCFLLIIIDYHTFATSSLADIIIIREGGKALLQCQQGKGRRSATYGAVKALKAAAAAKKQGSG